MRRMSESVLSGKRNHENLYNDSNLKGEIWHHSECFVTSSFEWWKTLVHPRFSSSSSSSWAMGTQLLTSHSGTGVSWTNGCWGSGLWNFDQMSQWIVEKMGCYESLSSQGLGPGYHKAQQIFHGLDFKPKNCEFKCESSLFVREPSFQTMKACWIFDLWWLVLGLATSVTSEKIRPKKKKKILAPEDLPFALQEAPGNYTELTLTLGWEVRCPGLGLGARPRPRSGRGGSKNWEIFSGWVEIQKTSPIFCWVGHHLLNKRGVLDVWIWTQGSTLDLPKNHDSWLEIP